MGVQPFFPKRVAEKIAIGLDFSDEVPTGVTITSGVCSARIYKTEADATATILTDGTGATIDAPNNIAKVVVNAGAAGVMYEVLFLLTLSTGHKLEGLARVFVDN